MSKADAVKLAEYIRREFMPRIESPVVDVLRTGNLEARIIFANGQSAIVTGKVAVDLRRELDAMAKSIGLTDKGRRVAKMIVERNRLSALQSRTADEEQRLVELEREIESALA